MSYRDKTLIFTTDNSVNKFIFSFCQKQILKESNGIPIISISQKPIQFGENYCIGEIGRSWLSLYRQLLLGLQYVKTKYIIIAEHDVCYTSEHFDWTPPCDDVFYYNHNCWFVYWNELLPEHELNGKYSIRLHRFALSQLICSRDLLKEALMERSYLLENGYNVVGGLAGVGEPGVEDKRAIGKFKKNDRKWDIRKPHLPGNLKEYKSASFSTVIPNLDIRHSSNFTGFKKRGEQYCDSLPYWGKFENLINDNK